MVSIPNARSRKSWVRSGKILYKTFRRDSLRLGPNKSGVELMAELAERVFQICPSIPKDIDATALTTTMVQTFVPPETPDEIRKQFAFNCVTALDCVRKNRAAVWKN